MTCIIGYKDQKNSCVYIGADSLGSNSYTKTVRNDPKFFHYTKDIIFGFTTSYRMGQLIMYADNLFSEINIHDKEFFTHKNLVTKFIPNLIKLYKENEDDNIDKNGTFILATFDKLWKIYDNFQVQESLDNFVSCGSGEELALGALYALQKNDNYSIVEKIVIGLESAEKFSCSVQRPFHIINTSDNNIQVIK
jgi:ATP-dependent protease HslVU (ClpYQ) peptidase subunit